MNCNSEGALPSSKQYVLYVCYQPVGVLSFSGSFCRCWYSSVLFFIECRGRVVSISASYSGGPGFKSWPGTAIMTQVFVAFLSPFRKIAGIVP
jgi:hypothetical protein